MQTSKHCTGAPLPNGDAAQRSKGGTATFACEICMGAFKTRNFRSGSVRSQGLASPPCSAGAKWLEMKLRCVACVVLHRGGLHGPSQGPESLQQLPAGRPLLLHHLGGEFLNTCCPSPLRRFTTVLACAKHEPKLAEDRGST